MWDGYNFITLLQVIFMVEKKIHSHMSFDSGLYPLSLPGLWGGCLINKLCRDNMQEFF